MPSTSIILPLIVAVVGMTNAHSLARRQEAVVRCGPNGILRATDDDVPLTNDDLDALCPDWETNPFVKIQHATHCGNNPEKTKWLQKSIKNRLFGGNPAPPYDSASMNFTDSYDCTAHCVKNGEGKGHFKYDAAKNCFKFRGTGMCGGPEEDIYASGREDRLCNASPCNIIKDGSFESGSFGPHWGTKDLASPLVPLQVTTAVTFPGFGFFIAHPDHGSFVAAHGFDGGGSNNDNDIDIWQEVLIPENSIFAELSFVYEAAWNLVSFCHNCNEARLLDVVVEPVGGGAPLFTHNVITAQPRTMVLSTGRIRHTVDLTAFIGQTVRVNLAATILQQFTGPALLSLDDVQLNVGVADSEFQCVVGPS